MDKKLVHGVGTHEKGKYSSWVSGKATKEYSLWNDMLRRCYSKKHQEKQKAYIGCSVSDEFLNYQGFMLWAEKQVGFGRAGYQLDKDILVKWNKVYTAEACVFIPSEINNILMSRRSMRGDLPIGVSAINGRYRATIGRGSRKRDKLGMFATPEDAFNCYKEAKEEFIKQQAERYKDSVDERVYNTMMAYEVAVTD